MVGGPSVMAEVEAGVRGDSLHIESRRIST